MNDLICFLCKEPNHLLITDACIKLNGRKICLKCELKLQEAKNKAMNRPTVYQMVKESELAVRLGVDYFVIKQCSLPDKGETGMMQFNLDDYENPEIINALKTCENLSTKDTEIIVKWNLIMQKGKKLYDGCPSIPLLLEISGNGDVYPCGHMFGNKPQFDKYKMGNLHDISLKDIIQSDKYWDIIKDMRYNFDVHSQCKGACRQDKTNEFVYNYLNSPRGINFI